MAYERNLLIVHTPAYQGLADWSKVKSLIEERADDIDVRITGNAEAIEDVRSWQISRPSLVFSPYRLLAYRPLGGKIYAGARMDKLEELKRLAAAGPAGERPERGQPWNGRRQDVPAAAVDTEAA